MAAILRQFTGRETAAPVQFIKYALCGVGAVAAHVAVFYLLSWLALPALNERDIVVRTLHLPTGGISDTLRAHNAMINNAMAFVFSNLTAYLLNIFWVFESGRRYPPVDYFLGKLGPTIPASLRACAHRTVEILLFYAVSGIAVVIGTFLMGVMIDRWHCTTTTAFGMQCALAILINFILRKFVIFKR